MADQLNSLVQFSNALTACSLWAVTKTIAGGRDRPASTSASCTPESPGMLMSRKMTSYGIALMSWSASMVLLASPTTSTPEPPAPTGGPVKPPAAPTPPADSLARLREAKKRAKR